MRPIATWNPARDAWETPNTESLLCGHSDVYSETFTTSGTTRSGVAYALPTWVPRTAGSASSSSPDDALIPTPAARDWRSPGTREAAHARLGSHAQPLSEIGNLLPTPAASVTNDGEDVAHWDERRERIRAKGINGNSMGEPLTIAAQRLLPTPSANVGTNGGSQHPDKRRAGNHQPSIQDVAEHVLIPVAACPTCGCPEDLHDGGDFCGGPCGGNGYNCYGRMPEAEFRLLQTPTVWITLGGSRSRSGARSDEKLLPAQAEEMTTDWGPYAPAIHRWELAIGQPAPSPTEPNKAGKPRLSPRFTEWMMGVPAGWITDTPGVSRNDQLKAAGNGVVPQQAAAALTDMLAAFGAREAAA